MHAMLRNRLIHHYAASVQAVVLFFTGTVAQAKEPLHHQTTAAHRSDFTRASTAGETLINRYSSVSLQPSDADLNPIAVVAQVTFPRQKVKTVGDAIHYLLLRTGYDLQQDVLADQQVVKILGKRLPDSQRELGPYQVDTMFKVLMGQSFDLQIDHQNRTIAYRLKTPSPYVASVPAAAKGNSHSLNTIRGPAPGNFSPTN